MKKSNTSIVCAYILLVLEFLYMGTEEHSILATIMKLLIYCAIIGLVFMCIFNVFLFISNLTQSITYAFYKMGTTPVLLYPFVIIPSEKMKIRLYWDLFKTIDFFMPSGFYEKELDRSLIKKVVGSAQLNGFIGQVILGNIVFWGSILYRQYFMAASIIAIMITLFLMGNEKSNSYCGLFIRRRQMQEDKDICYLLGDLGTYNDNLFYVTEFKEFLQNNENSTDVFVIEAIKRMFMIAASNTQVKIDESVDDYIEERILLTSMLDWEGGMEVFIERFDFMKIYMCYAMIVNDADKLIKVLNYFRILKAEEDRNAFSSWVIIDWYLNIGENSYIYPQKSLIKNKIIRANQFAFNFANYKNNYKSMVENVKAICAKER